MNGLRDVNATNRASGPSSVDYFRARATTILLLLLALLAGVVWYLLHRLNG
jgi:hypothetical protein